MRVAVLSHENPPGGGRRATGTGLRATGDGLRATGPTPESRSDVSLVAQDEVLGQRAS
ncbi:MAG: hypothetical protein ACRD3E_05550 [Terriglobales bacterium]